MHTFLISHLAEIDNISLIRYYIILYGINISHDFCAEICDMCQNENYFGGVFVVILGEFTLN